MKTEKVTVKKVQVMKKNVLPVTIISICKEINNGMDDINVKLLLVEKNLDKRQTIFDGASNRLDEIDEQLKRNELKFEAISAQSTTVHERLLHIEEQVMQTETTATMALVVASISLLALVIKCML
jgi:archaellum component FlaC